MPSAGDYLIVPLDHPERTAVIRYGPADGRRRAIVAFIAGFHDRTGTSPTIREIGAAVGLRSVSSVHAQLVLLERAGAVKSSPGIPRSIRVVQQ